MRAAVAGNPRFEVDALEIERGGPSYSRWTRCAPSRRGLAPELPVFVIGHDAFVELDTWREPESAASALAHFAVTTRPPGGPGSLADWLPRRLEDDVELAPDGLSGRHRSGRHLDPADRDLGARHLVLGHPGATARGALGALSAS